MNEIMKEVEKPDGSSPSETAVYDTIALCRKHGPGWNGEVRPSKLRGPARKTTPDLFEDDNLGTLQK